MPLGTRWWVTLGLALAWAISLHAVTRMGGGPEASTATAAELSNVKSYGISFGKNFIKDEFDIDLSNLDSTLDMDLLGQPGNALPGMFGEGSMWTASPLTRTAHDSFQVRFAEDRALTSLNSALQDIPFAVKVHALTVVPWKNFEVDTNLFVPLGRQDEMKAETDFRVPSLAPDWMAGLFDQSGFESPVMFRSIYGNRMGLNDVDTTLGTQWLKVLNLNYELQYRFGEDAYEEIQWLKVDTKF